MVRPDCDLVVLSEAEGFISAVVEAALEGKDTAGMTGLVVRRGESIVHGGLAPLVEDLEVIPRPDWPALHIDQYRRHTEDISVLTSRGCPYSCSFCGVQVVSRRSVRYHSINRVMSELETLVGEYGFRRVTFFDDTFTLHRPRTIELLNAIECSGLKFRWSCETRVDRVDADLFDRMYQAGCDRVFFGIESGCQRILDGVNKSITLEQIRTAVRCCSNAGIRPFLSIIVGLPEDDAESIRETIAFANSLGAERVWFQPFTPFPGSPAAHLSKQSPRALHTFDLRTPQCGTNHLTHAEVKYLYLEALLSRAEVTQR